MAKKKRKQRSKPRAARPPARPAARAPLPEARIANDRAPAFWFGFEIAWAKLVVFRFALFGLLAIDSLLQLSHAPRYGAGDLELAHLGWLDGLGPGRAGYTVGQLVVAYLLALAAMGVATRWGLPIAAAVYGWLYFGSQLDSYQHHYLVAILLVLASCVPWRRPGPEAEPTTPVRSWALRLILVQLAIVYLWAAISKLDPAWLDGRTLATQLTGRMRELAEAVGFDVAAIAVVAAELGLAATLWNRRTWRIAAPLGLALHVGIIASDLEVGVFGFLMVVLYLLVLPDRAFVRVASLAQVRAAARRWRELADRPGWIALGVAVVVAIVAAVLLRLPYAIASIALCSLVPVGLALRAFLRDQAPRAGLAIAHVVAIMAWQVVDRSTTTSVDYYKRWAGSQRRLGDAEEAERAYRGLLAIAPDDASGHFHLGRLLLARGEDTGLEHLREAQRLDPVHARSFIEEARYLARIGRVEEAIHVAKRGAAAEPSNAEAQQLVQALLRAAASRPLGPGDDDD